MEPILVFGYTPEKRDYVRATRILAKKSRGFRFLAAITLLVLLASAVILALPTIGGKNLRSAALIAFLVALVYTFYYLILIPFQLNRTFKRNESLRVERKLTFLDDHLRLNIGSQVVELPWENVKRVIDGGDTFLLIYEGNEPVYPFIPQRAFPDENSKTDFLDFIRSKSIPVI